MNGTHRKPVRTTIRAAGDSIRRRETFVAGDGSLTGGHAGPISERGDFAGLGDMGRLSPLTGVYAVLRHAYSISGARLYVVRSYGTPIAWAAPGEALTVPAVRYSVTTSRHQGIARRADTAGECDVCGLPMTAAPMVRAAGHVHRTS